jgi:Fe-S-cluster containining protein
MKIKYYIFGDFTYMLKCPFFIFNRCTIYNYRPLRCRSYPLILNHIDFALTIDGFCKYETYNFTDEQLQQMYNDFVFFDAIDLNTEMNTSKKMLNKVEDFKDKMEVKRKPVLKNGMFIGMKYWKDLKIASEKLGLKKNVLFLNKFIENLSKKNSISH